MKVASTLGLALRRLRRRPIRSLLLLQGTVWGVAVAIFPSAVIQGTRDAALNQGTELGANRIAVTADPTSARDTVLRTDDMTHLRDAVEQKGFGVRALGGFKIGQRVPKPGGDTDDVCTVLASTPDGPRARGMELEKGRWLRADDDGEKCVVEARVARWLGRPSIEPGDTIRVSSRMGDLEVVGVTKARNETALTTDDLGMDLAHPLYQSVAQQFLLVMGIPLVVSDEWKRSEQCVYVPAQVAGEAAVLDWIYMRVDTVNVSDAATAMRQSMVERDKTVVTLYPLVLPVVTGNEVDRFGAVNIAMFLACLAMGAVVMANLGLLNVLSRSREIAIRRVEGATRRDIASHFLIEGLLLSAIGCGLGCVFGMMLAELRAELEPVAGFTWTFPFREAAWACAVAMIIGLLAALLPAIRASKQEPVRGLADE